MGGRDPREQLRSGLRPIERQTGVTIRFLADALGRAQAVRESRLERFVLP